MQVRFYWLWLLMVCLLKAELAIAEQNVLPQKLEPSAMRYGLFIAPKNCLLADNQQNCQLEVLINWQTKLADSYCLFQNQQPSPIQCWQNTAQASLKVLIDSDKAVTFELRAARDNQLFYQSTLKLLRQSKKQRQRRRNPWSFY